MTRLRLLTGLMLAAAQGQPWVFYNQGALVHVQSGALVHVQGGYQNNDQGANPGITNNYGTIQLVDAAGGWRGNLLNGIGAEFNTYTGSLTRLQGDYTNEGAYRAGASGYGGTIEFFGTTAQNYTNTGNATQWTHQDVLINNTAAMVDRHVIISPTAAQDMWINGTLTLQSGRIRTDGPTEVRVLNTNTAAVVRPTWPPVTAATFATLVAPDNQHQYVQGRLRRNTAAGSAYAFPVGGDQATRGIQGTVITPAQAGYVRVQFDITVQGFFSEAPYCRGGDPDVTNTYIPLDNGRWEVVFYGNGTNAHTSTTPVAGNPSSVRMFNRVVTNATVNGNCPAAGAPGDENWGNYPTDLCYVGYNQRATPPGLLNPPNNCEGSNTGWDVTRTGFNDYNQHGQNGTYYFATVWTSNNPLPSAEIRLTAVPDGQAILTAWRVPEEAEYILGYELERSIDAQNFTRIAQVDKQGRTQYTFNDQYVAPGITYFYRVAQHDVFGNVRYSNVAEATLPQKGELFTAVIQPNPILTEGTLLVNLPAEGVLSFQLYDAAGKLVAQGDWTLAADAHQLDLSPILAKVAAGIYNALVSFGGDVKTLRLIKADLSR